MLNGARSLIASTAQFSACLFNGLYKNLKQAFAMHELSIANNLVQIALEHIKDYSNVRVQQINLRIGSLSCVHRDSLLFSFDLVTADTSLAGTKLHITALPVVIYCPTCEKLQEIPGVQAFRCPECQTLSADIRQGQELDIESIEIVDLPAVTRETESCKGGSCAVRNS